MLYASYIFIVTVLCAIDQYSKYLVDSLLKPQVSYPIIKNFFSLTYVRNTGAAFSILQDQLLFLIITSFIAIIVIIYLLIKTKETEVLSRISYLFILSGAIGNNIDRLKLGYVIDFLDFIIFKYDFPIFNIADSLICIGAFLLIINILKEYKNANN